VAEALAALHAVETCKEMGFYDIILEEDALQIVDVIKATCNNWSSFGHIVDGIKLEQGSCDLSELNNMLSEMQI
jgi:ribonuclease HI